MSNDRSPDEILSVFDQAQAELDLSDPGVYSLRDLLWEVLDAALFITRDTAMNPHPKTPVHDRAMEVHTSLDQFLGNNFGDD